MGRIKKLKGSELIGWSQDSTTEIYPVTSTHAVFDDDNVALSTLLSNLKALIETASKSKSSNTFIYAFAITTTLESPSINLKSTSYPPTTATGDPSLWTKTNISSYKGYLWMTTSLKDSSGNLVAWSDGNYWLSPVCLGSASGDTSSTGTDGKFNYVYFLTNLEPNVFCTNAYKPTFTVALIEELGTIDGWHDHPLGVSSDYVYEYCSTATRQSDGTFGAYGIPFLWSHYGENGRDGDTIEYVYCLTDSAYDDPTLIINKKTNYTDRNGKTFQEDDFLPENPLATTDVNYWYDNALGVSEDSPYEYVATRKKQYDEATLTYLWSAFTTPALWARYGKDGVVSEYFLDCDNSSVVIDTKATKALLSLTTTKYTLRKASGEAVSGVTYSVTTSEYNYGEMYMDIDQSTGTTYFTPRNENAELSEGRYYVIILAYLDSVAVASKKQTLIVKSFGAGDVYKITLSNTSVPVLDGHIYANTTCTVTSYKVSSDETTLMTDTEWEVDHSQASVGEIYYTVEPDGSLDELPSLNCDIDSGILELTGTKDIEIRESYIVINLWLRSSSTESILLDSETIYTVLQGKDGEDGNDGTDGIGLSYKIVSDNDSYTWEGGTTSTPKTSLLNTFIVLRTITNADGSLTITNSDFQTILNSNGSSLTWERGALTLVVQKELIDCFSADDPDFIVLNKLPYSQDGYIFLLYVCTSTLSATTFSLMCANGYLKLVDLLKIKCLADGTLGLNGALLRTRGYWTDCVGIDTSYRNNDKAYEDNALAGCTCTFYSNTEDADGIRYIDVVLYNNKYYQCALTHTIDEAADLEDNSTPGHSTTFWVEATKYDFIVTDTMIADAIKTTTISAKDVVIEDSDDNVVAGMTSSDPTSESITADLVGSVRIWSGSTSASNIQSAPFRVYEDGSVIMTDALIKGDISATSFNVINGTKAVMEITTYNSATMSSLILDDTTRSKLITGVTPVILIHDGKSDYLILLTSLSLPTGTIAYSNVKSVYTAGIATSSKISTVFSATAVASSLLKYTNTTSSGDYSSYNGNVYYVNSTTTKDASTAPTSLTLAGGSTAGTGYVYVTAKSLTTESGYLLYSYTIDIYSQGKYKGTLTLRYYNNYKYLYYKAPTEEEAKAGKYGGWVDDSSGTTTIAEAMAAVNISF